MPKSRIFNVANMSFNAFRENNIIAKITVGCRHILFVKSSELRRTYKRLLPL